MLAGTKRILHIIDTRSAYSKCIYLSMIYTCMSLMPDGIEDGRRGFVRPLLPFSGIGRASHQIELWIWDIIIRD